MNYYKKTEDYWNTVFDGINVRLLESHKSGHEVLDKALDWVSEDASKFLDFGSGSGAVLAYLAKRKPGEYYGIDVSPSAIDLANRLFVHNDLKTGLFKVGSIEALNEFSSNTFDAVILSNILDNLKESDALDVLSHTHRLLKASGKLFIKLNPYFDPEALDRSQERLDDDFYLESSGLYLWNKTDQFWINQLEKDYTIIEQTKLYFNDDDYNRIFLCIKKS